MDKLIYKGNTRDFKTFAAAGVTKGSYNERAIKYFQTLGATANSFNTAYDQALNIVNGPEFVTNGTFDTDVSGWTAAASSTITFSAGQLRLDATALDGIANGVAYQQILGLEIGDIILVKAEITQGTGSLGFGVGNGIEDTSEFFTGLNGSTTVQTTITLGVADPYLNFIVDSVDGTQFGLLDNVSVKKLN